MTKIKRFTPGQKLWFNGNSEYKKDKAIGANGSYHAIAVEDTGTGNSSVKIRVKMHGHYGDSIPGLPKRCKQWVEGETWVDHTAYRLQVFRDQSDEI